MSLKKAALAGLIYAVLMCVWYVYGRDGDPDQIWLRFAAYFSIFTLGFWFLYNLLFGHFSKRDRDS